IVASTQESLAPSTAVQPILQLDPIQPLNAVTCTGAKWCSISHRRCTDTCPAGTGSCIPICVG
ncbi:MAG TPA: hypothetical protein VMM92_03095, partial [Thermoanaerobaculia bacterium]|nr:hypothetical protein [Thermoanaerobaculia bacterium]